MLYLLRVCMPVRDWVRVADLLANIENRQVIRHTVDRLFPNRPDLDAVDVVVALECSPVYARMLRRRLARRVSGSIGFFALYRLRKHEPF